MKMEHNAYTGSHIGDTHSNEPAGYTTAEKGLKPILLSLKICGVYFDPTPARNKIGDSESESPVSKPSRVFTWFTGRLFCVVVCLLLWFNFIRCLVGFFPIDSGLPYRVIIITWFLQCAFNSTIMLTSCQRLSQFRDFYKYWDSLFKDSTTQEIGCAFKCPMMYLKVATFVGWGIFVMNIVVVYAVLFGNLPSSKDLTDNLVRPFTRQNWSLVLIAVMHVFETGAWIFPFVFLIVISRCIQAQFHRFKSCLSKQIDEADGCIPDRLPELRCRYTRMCQVVEIINGTFKWILGVSFILSMFLLCFTSYQIINRPYEIFDMITMLFWLSACFLALLVLVISSYQVHDTAHCLLEDIFRIGTKNATTEQLGQLNLFVAKLTGTSIGFTAVDFFVITREFLLSLAGLYATYFFLLLQFRIA